MSVPSTRRCWLSATMRRRGLPMCCQPRWGPVIAVATATGTASTLSRLMTPGKMNFSGFEWEAYRAPRDNFGILYRNSYPTFGPTRTDGFTCGSRKGRKAGLARRSI